MGVDGYTSNGEPFKMAPRLVLPAKEVDAS